MDANDKYDFAPIAIGGVGGSGTRLVAQILRSCGIYLGCDLNEAYDALLFTLLFKRAEILQCDDAEFDLSIQVLQGSLRGRAPLTPQTVELLDRLSRQDRPQHSAGWLRQRADFLIHTTPAPVAPRRWGWKEPNTHIVIERLWKGIPNLRYVHVVRHGMYMAHSSNQNQLQLWGPHLLGEDGPVTPARALAYWCRVHQRMQALLASNPQRMYWLDYDALCQKPEFVLSELFAFLQLDPSQIEQAASGIQTRLPCSTTYPRDKFANEDVEYLQALGYPVFEAA